MTAPGIRDGNRAVVYLRVSTDDQATSIEAQRATCARIAAQHGYEIVGEYLDESVSGAIAIDKRPALKQALADLASDMADRLIVAKLDRLARNVRVALEIDEDYAARHGWGIVLGDMDIDTSTAAGKLQLSMFASVAKFERDRISERTREALAVKRSQGIRLGRPPVLPTEIVQRIADERAAGASLRVIADSLTRDGIATAQGGQSWHASTVRKVLASQQAGEFTKHIVAEQIAAKPREEPRMYGVWQTGELFRFGAQPRAVSNDRSKLSGWATRNMQEVGKTMFFFVECAAPEGKWTESDVVCSGHRYPSGEIIMKNKHPERFVRERRTSIANGLPKLTDEQKTFPTVNIDLMDEISSIYEPVREAAADQAGSESIAVEGNS